MVVSSDVFTTVNGVTANLVLPCNATGDPFPFFKWFREDTAIEARFFTRDGTLATNVSNTSYIEASREGVRYHCTATTNIGVFPFIATTRSKDYHVFYTCKLEGPGISIATGLIASFVDFDGFEALTMSTTELGTVEGGVVAMRCDHKEGMPIPEIAWYKIMDNGGGPIELRHESRNRPLRFLDHGRYLLITFLTSEDRNSSFYCMVTNAYLGTAPQRSFITYTLNRDIPDNQLILYKQNTQTIATVGSTVIVAYPVAYRQGNIAEDVTLSCHLPTNYLNFISSSILGTASGFTNAGVENIPCFLIFSSHNKVFVLFSILVLRESPFISRMLS